MLGRSSLIIDAYSVASFIMILLIMKLVIDNNRKIRHLAAKHETKNGKLSAFSQ